MSLHGTDVRLHLATLRRDRIGPQRVAAHRLGMACSALASRETGRTRWHLAELADFLEAVNATPEERLQVLDLARTRAPSGSPPAPVPDVTDAEPLQLAG